MAYPAVWVLEIIPFNLTSNTTKGAVKKQPDEKETAVFPEKVGLLSLL